ncbi:MAG: YesL family protein [Lachnospiraceae bacterium]|nr:YesL family protein [Lachnospiraceae bacterium]
MKDLFGLDSPVNRGLGLLFDLVELNLLFLLCSVPVFTIGASFTALHHVILQMLRKEDGYIAKEFFKAFRKEFRQSTVIWLILLAVIVLLLIDQTYLLPLFEGTAFFSLLFVSALVLEGVWLLIFSYVFALQSRYGNPVLQTFKNSFLVGILNLPYTVCVCFLLLFLPLLYMILPVSRPVVMFLYFICGFSVSVFAGDIILNRVFLKTFPEERTSQGKV